MDNSRSNSPDPAQGSADLSSGRAGVHTLLTPDNCAVVLIDHQPQMAFAVQSIDRQTLVNNVVGLAKAAKIFNVPVLFCRP